MPRRSPGDALQLLLPPLTALSIGLWEEEVGADCLRGDALMADLFGFSEAEMARGVSWEHFRSRIHPDDLARDPERQSQVRTEGGLFVWEHRIVRPNGSVRWVLARGQFVPDFGRGSMVGRGFVIDTTDLRIEGHAEGVARFIAPYDGAVSSLERIADHAIEIWKLVRNQDTKTAALLQPLVEMLMHEVGRQIAASMIDAPPWAPVSKLH